METVICAIIASVIDVLVCIIYYHLLLGAKKKSIHYPLWFFCFILMEAALYINVLLGNYISGLPLTLISTLISILSMYLLTFLYNSNTKHRLYTVISFQIIAIISEVVAFTLFISMFSAISGHKPDSDQFAFLISKFVMLFFVFIVGLIYKNREDKSFRSNSFRLLISPLLSIVVIFCIWYSKESNVDKSPIEYVPTSIVALALALINITNYYYLISDLSMKELIKKEKETKTNLLLQQEKYSQMAEHYKEVRSMVHDALKHDRYILSCAENNDCKSIMEYLEKDIDSYTKDLALINSHNLAIDVIINTYIKICRKTGIDFIQEVSLGQGKLPINDYDMNIMLGNILENAVNHTAALPEAFIKTIELKITRMDGKLLIFEKNPCQYDGEHTIYPDDYYKNTHDGHGYGINNIYKTCEKLKGISTFEIAGNYFTVRIIIPLSIDNPNGGKDDI